MKEVLDIIDVDVRKCKNKTVLDVTELNSFKKFLTRGGQNYIPSKEVFRIIETYCPGEKHIRYELKFVKAKMGDDVKGYLESKFKLSTQSKLAKQAFKTSFRSTFGLPQCSVDHIWEALEQDAKRDSNSKVKTHHLYMMLIDQANDQVPDLDNPEEIRSKLVRAIHSAYQSSSGVKDVLNILGVDQQQVDVVTFIEIFSDKNNLLTAVEARILFCFLLDKYDSGSKTLPGY